MLYQMSSLQTNTWLNLGQYTELIFTFKGPVNDTLYLYWTSTNTAYPPTVYGPDVSSGNVQYTDSFPIFLNTGQSYTLRVPVRSQWVMYGFAGATAITASQVEQDNNYVPTAVQLHQPAGDQRAHVHVPTEITPLSYNSLQTVWTDPAGQPIGSTSSLFNNALTVNFDGFSTVYQPDLSASVLSVGLMDSSNHGLFGTNPTPRYCASFNNLAYFPDTEVYVLIDRSYSMATADLGTYTNDLGTAVPLSRYFLIYNYLLPYLVSFLQDTSAYNLGSVNLNILTYGRLDTSCTDSSIGIDYGYTTAGHNPIWDTSAEPFRTLLPGGYEFQTFNPGTAQSGLATMASNVNTNFVSYAGIYASLSDSSMDHALHDASYYPFGSFYLVPGAALYTTVDRFFAVSGPTTYLTASGVGNLDLILNPTATPDLSLITINPADGIRRILIQITDNSISDDIVDYDSSVQPGVYTYGPAEQSLLTQHYNNGQAKLQAIFGSNIYSFNLDPNLVTASGPDPLTMEKIVHFLDPVAYANTLGNAPSLSQLHTYYNGYDLSLSGNGRFYPAWDTSYGVILNNFGSLLNVAFDPVYTANHALLTAWTDVCGLIQASTLPVTTSYFPGRALYYALSDYCGNQIGSTLTVSLTPNNATATYVYDNIAGVPIDETGIYVEYTNGVIALGPERGSPFNFIVTSSLCSASTISNGSIQLSYLGFVNETAVPVWIKVYNLPYATYHNTSNWASIVGEVVYNVGVPAEATRDLYLSDGVIFDQGVCMRVSTTYPYDSSNDVVGSSAESVYATGLYLTAAT
jgi:hypothetical protein